MQSKRTVSPWELSQLKTLYLASLSILQLASRSCDLSPEFVLAFTALAYDLYYLSGAWIRSSSSGGCNSSGSNFFGIDNTNICMPTLVN